MTSYYILGFITFFKIIIIIITFWIDITFWSLLNFWLTVCLQPGAVTVLVPRPHVLQQLKEENIFITPLNFHFSHIRL